MRLTLVLLPLLTAFFLVYALRPNDAIAPRRLAVLRAALAVGAFAVAGVELLSLLRWITPTGVGVLWLIGLAASAVLAGLKRGRHGAGGRRRTARWADAVRSTTLAERLLGGGLVVLVLAELLLALVSAPNNYDSNYYHLPKVEHWAAQHSVDLYATFMRPQVVLAPGAEYLLLHLRLLTGGDRAYNLVQWAAALGCALVASRIAAQLGAGRLGQLIAAATVAAAPMVVLESTSTQNDLVVAAWLVCAASLVVDTLGRRTGWRDVLAIGVAAGLTVVTKPTGWVALAPVLLLWGLSAIRPPAAAAPAARHDRHNSGEVAASGPRRGHNFGDVVPNIGRAAAGTVGIVALVALLAGPYLVRVNATFGSPLGPPEQSAGLSMQRHDPPAVLVNALRIGASTLAIPVPAVNRAVADAVIAVAHAVGVDPQDPAITVGSSRYPNPRWWPDEDHSPYPVQSALVLLATAGLLVAPRIPGRVRAYALTVLGALVLYAVVLKWQTWGDRLVGGGLILGAPLVGWALPRLVRPGRRAVAAVVAAVMAAGLAHGYYAVLLGSPRPLIGDHSMLTRGEWDQRFARHPEWKSEYQWTAAAVRASGAKRVGILVWGDQYEYPWWRLLPGVDLVALESVVPHHPAARPDSVGAIMCAAPPAICQSYVPAGWHFETRGGWYSFAVPRR